MLQAAAYARLETRVSAFRGHRVLASETVRSGHVYRFTLRPGHYQLTNTGSAALKYPVTLTAGSTVRLDLPDLCK
jgi:hypothetical protein